MKTVPLAEAFRPKSLSEVVGQDHLVGPDGWITRIIKEKKPLSILLWGPPGSGKTTIARLYAKSFEARFIAFSAVFNGVGDLKKVINEIKGAPLLQSHVILFVDEIHRFNKAQQDAFLPYIEDGTIILVGATTENPSFSLNNALLSRLRVLTLHYLDLEALHKIVGRFEAHEETLPLTVDAKESLVNLAAGDARHLLNMIENIRGVEEPLTTEKLATYVQKRPALYDKGDEGHYNLISALHKAIRGSDPDAALYWLARMLEGGEDPNFLGRRLVRMASEDVGLADPDALGRTLDAWQTFERLGSPEGELALAQAVIYLSLAPKSNAAYMAYKSAQSMAKKSTQLMPPKHSLNAPTRLMKDEGYGKGYIYDHDTKEGFSGQNYFPEERERECFYAPVERGFEREMKKRIDYFNSLRAAAGASRE